MQSKTQLLVIDDDLDILKVLKANLEIYEFSAITAEDWAKAQKILEHKIPDLVILDLMLPDGNGIDICKILKERCPKMPIIMLTAKDRVSDKVLGLESGADDYIVKPFETLELIARIKACLRRIKPSENRIVIDDIEIDINARTLKIRGKNVELTKREFDLLKLLVTNSGEIINRDFIRKKLWGNAKLYAWSRTIDVHIMHLRQKIEKNPSAPEYLLTIPGSGYKFKH